VSLTFAPSPTYDRQRHVIEYIERVYAVLLKLAWFRELESYGVSPLTRHLFEDSGESIYAVGVARARRRAGLVVPGDLGYHPVDEQTFFSARTSQSPPSLVIVVGGEMQTGRSAIGLVAMLVAGLSKSIKAAPSSVSSSSSSSSPPRRSAASPVWDAAARRHQCKESRRALVAKTLPSRPHRKHDDIRRRGALGQSPRRSRASYQARAAGGAFTRH